jgi:hypothetical protein
MTFGPGEAKLSEWVAKNAPVAFDVCKRPWEVEAELILNGLPAAQAGSQSKSRVSFHADGAATSGKRTRSPVGHSVLVSGIRQADDTTLALRRVAGHSMQMVDLVRISRFAAQNAKAAARTKDSAAASKLRAIVKDQASRAADALVTEKRKNLPEGSGTR